MLMIFQRAVQAALIAAVLASAAAADHGNDNRNNNAFHSSIIGSSPNSSAGGVVSGGAPWVVREGSASIGGRKLEVEVSGLLLGPGAPAAVVGTVGPVQMVAASVVCGGSGGTVAATTEAVSLSSLGDAHIESGITLPSPCLAPVVLIRIANPGTQPGAFIAATGLSAAQANDENDNHDKDDDHGDR